VIPDQRCVIKQTQSVIHSLDLQKNSPQLAL
jgi:hypothetical protein